MRKRGSTGHLHLLRLCFVESYFGVLINNLKMSGPSVHPLRGAKVAVARHNNAFDVPMLECDAKGIVVEDLRPDVDTSTHHRLRAQPTKSDRLTTWWLLHKSIARSKRCRTGTHKSPKGSPTGG